MDPQKFTFVNNNTLIVMRSKDKMEGTLFHLKCRS